MNKSRKPFRIYIKNLSNTYNYGTMMMGENLINALLTRLDRPIEFYIDTDQHVHIERLKTATGHPYIFADQIELTPLWTRKFRYVRYLEKRLRKKSMLRKIASFYEAVIILGGDDYAETYYTFPKDDLLFRSIFNDLSYLGKRIKIIMVGQTIGPFSGSRIKVAQKGLKETIIYVRDLQTKLYLQNHLALTSHLSTDLAFLDLPLQKEHQDRQHQILGKYGLKQRSYFTLVGTGLINHYTNNQSLFIKTFVSLIENLQLRYPDHKVLILSHVSNKESPYSDNTFIELIEQSCPRLLEKQGIVIKESILPAEARILLGNGDLTISCRMHAAVSTFQMGTPAICLSYSKKFGGVIGQNLKRSDLVIEAKNNAFWEEDPVSVIMDKIDYALFNKANLVESIQNEIRANKAMLESSLSELADLLEHS